MGWGAWLRGDSLDKDFQNSLIEAVQILVEEEIKKTSYTSSYIGKIKSINAFDAVVEIYGEDHECKILEHLQTSISVGDIVII